MGPWPRGLAIRLGRALLTSLDWLLPRALHRQLLLTSTLMGTLDVVLDETASSGEAAVLRIASLISREAPTSQLPTEQPIARLAQTIRRYESAWQSDFWETVLQPSVRKLLPGGSAGRCSRLPDLPIKRYCPAVDGVSPSQRINSSTCWAQRSGRVMVKWPGDF